jgi:hypothetical protein
MAGLLLINPRRRKARKARKSRRGRARKMSALQMKYFGKRRGSARVHANPKRRRRSLRRNPSNARRRQRGFARSGGIRIPRVSFNVNAIQSAAKTAAIGASGALAVDILMGQAGRVLPATWMGRYNTDGSINWPYYLTKAALAVGVGVLGAKVAKGGDLAQKAAVGSLTVQAYELLRSFMPADLVTLGYYSPARIAGVRGRLGLYQRAPAGTGATGTSLSRLRGLRFGSVRVGEGRVR